MHVCVRVSEHCFVLRGALNVNNEVAGYEASEFCVFLDFILE